MHDHLQDLQEFAREEFKDAIRSLGADPDDPDWAFIIDPDAINEAFAFMPAGEEFAEALGELVETLV